MKFFVIFCLAFSGAVVSAQSLSDEALQKIRFDQKPGAMVSADLPFRDETGKQIHLGDYLGKKPVILVLGYYGCPMLCGLVLNGMAGGLQDIKWKMGRDYEVVCVSIDAHETPALAAAKKKSYVTRFGQPDAAAGWHFLTGDEPAIRQLAGQVGFNYAYDAAAHQYAHPSGLVVLSPSGKVSHYLTGVVFSGPDLQRALTDAADAKTGPPVDQIFLLCFHYNPLFGKYSALILAGVRAFGVAVLAALIVFIVTTGRRGKVATPGKG